MESRIRNKKLVTAVGLTLLLAVLVFAAGWLFGRLLAKHEQQAETATTTSKPATSGGVTAFAASHQIDAIRRGVPIDQEHLPPPMATVENADIKRTRAYPMQPPTIPHAIDSYQVDKNSNRCMLCHARANASTFQAPPVSVTHYMDRDDQFLATISPRRYFCNQCHVVQTNAPQLVANGFKDIDTVIAAGKE